MQVMQAMVIAEHPRRHVTHFSTELPVRVTMLAIFTLTREPAYIKARVTFAMVGD
jgi:hypothetical protein